MTEWTFFKECMWPAIRSRPGMLATSSLLVLATASSALLSAEAARAVLALATSHADVVGRHWTAQALAHAGIVDRQAQFRGLAAAALALPLFTYLMIFLRDFAFERLAIATTAALRWRLLDHVLRLDYLELVGIDRPGVVKRVMNDCARTRDLLIEGMLMRVSDVLLVGALGAYLIVLDASLGAAAVAVASIYFGVAWVSASLSSDALRSADKHYESLAFLIDETLGRVVDIRCFGRENNELRRLDERLYAESAARTRMARVLMADRTLTSFLAAAGPTLLLILGAAKTMSGTLAPPELLIIVLVTGLLFTPVNDLSSVPILLRNVQVALRNLAAVLALPAARQANLGECHAQSSAAVITMEGVRFSYPGSEQTLRVAHLEVIPGEIVALQGPSGSGKSTLLRLIFGLLTPDAGLVTVAGRNVGIHGYVAVRDDVVLLAQDPAIFAGTLAENLAYGWGGDGSAPQADLLSAAAAVGLAADIECMPHGLETALAPEGASLSSGQRKRIALARALLRRPRLILLDEPLEGVSPEERPAILAAIASLGGAFAVVIVTHQTDVARIAHRRYSLERDGASFSLVRSQGAMDV